MGLEDQYLVGFKRSVFRKDFICKGFPRRRVDRVANFEEPINQASEFHTDNHRSRRLDFRN
jgi:hypothetical protein